MKKAPLSFEGEGAFNNPYPPGQTGAFNNNLVPCCTLLDLSGVYEPTTFGLLA
jgi:hypothetical protein